MAFARTTALEFLRRAYEQNRLAHAYLITGAPGSGKELLAAELASLVNGTATKDVFSAKAREVFIARPESKSRRIVTAQIRALEHALQMRAADGRRKVAIVPDADRLQTEAANAFLKTLEEPPKDSLLLLLSALPEALPETILSRCISIPLASDGEPQSKKEQEKLVKLLQQASRQTTWNIQFAYRLAQEFQQLLRAVREEVKHETDEALKREQTRYKDATDGAWLEAREEYYKALAESLRAQGFDIVSGGTDNHLMLVDLRPKDLNGKEAQETLDRAGITVNKNAIPFDTSSPFKPGGIRVGTPAVTTRGMKEEEMLEIAELVAEALNNRSDGGALENVRKKVIGLTSRFPLPI